jgi:hypothetical protein
VKKSNAWHAAVIEHLRAAGSALTVEQIWQRMEAAGFKHASKLPRSTLGARVTELVQLKKVERVGPATYQLAAPQPLQQQQSSSEVSP